MELKGSQRRYLRGLANPLSSVIIIGKAGLTEAVSAAIDEALDNHELIKIRFLEFKDSRKELCAEIAAACHCHQVGLIGHVGIFYRANADAAKRRITLPAS
ncbi:MAG TPA: YhbY family RNA-binding protein [bacterium]|jgi:RNA-binding protein|nr:YhbY family RNA-binding protein [bacterium]HNT64659.1 YhbY family RNA-binding protein [bacterium]HOX85820.1 YhbY family RNA-binding protein [bacterium]HPG45197.1 YhbY family RNA-binding protein [bacterium]HPM97439.1 YhbY family RNA-binding protein [bacterium]